MKVGVGIGLDYPNSMHYKGGNSLFHPSLVDAWFMSGLKNEDKPATILGYKGHELTTSNFDWGGMSGVNGYNDNFKLWSINKENITYTSEKISTNNLNLSINDGVILYKNFAPKASLILNVRISGMRNEDILYFGKDKEYAYEFEKDGEYKIEYTLVSETNFNVGFRTKVNTTGLNITIEQIPLYEGSLVFDGIDDKLFFSTVGWKAGSILTGAIDLNPSIPPTRYFYVSIYGDDRLTLGKDIKGYFATERGNVSYKNNVFIANYEIRTVSETLGIGGYAYNTVSNMKMALQFIGIYENILTTEQADKEVIKLNNEWERRLKL